MPKITFVDESDNVIGAGTKEEALKEGKIHRIVRIFIFNSKGEMLIQKRSDKVTIWPGRWDQAVGGHVDEGEDYLEAAKREVKEELGIDDIELKEIKKYFADENDEEGRIKKRFNMLYKAVYEGRVAFNKEEVSEVKWAPLDKLEKWMKEKPDYLTPGFIKCLEIYNGNS